MSDILEASMIVSTFLTTYMVVQNYWYNDILDRLLEVIFFGILSWIFFTIVISFLVFITTIIYNNYIANTIVLIWIGLWIGRCIFREVNEPYKSSDETIIFFSLLSTAMIIYVISTMI
jgi:hypothetical protein